MKNETKNDLKIAMPFLAILISGFLWVFMNVPLAGIFVFFSVILLITAIYEIKNYYNKTLYLSILSACLAAVIILTYLYAPTDDKLIFYASVGVVIIGLVGIAYSHLRDWQKTKKIS